jgi:glycosyltransferase involved in cell wall biosynthesis
MPAKKLSLLFVITDLDCGGAEVMLYRLLSGLDRIRFAPKVVSLLAPGPIGRQIEALSIPVHSLGMQRGTPHPGALIRLTNLLRDARPDLMQTWMYHANLVGGLAARLAGRVPVMWGLHQSDLSWEGNRALTLLTIKACAYLSRSIPTHIICCSETTRQAHGAVGYAGDKLITIPNGYDVETFKPDRATRRTVREELEIPESAAIVGMVARFHPQKDHANLLRAAEIVLRNRPDVYFVLCGDGVGWNNLQLAARIDPARATRFRLLGRREDVHHVMATFDIATLSSFGEAFPNVVSEAMSCGIPCVVTDVGDARTIVGETGRVVPPKNAAALASGLLDLIDAGQEARAALGKAARQRIAERFALPAIVRRYEHLYEELAA